jgi:hypothetical protein
MAARRPATLSLVLCLAACGGIASPTTTSEPGIVVGEVSLVRSGGLAGITTTVTVRADGTVSVTNDFDALPEVSLPQPERDRLHALVGNSEFAALSETYVPPDGVCCDLYTYTVTAEVGDTIIESTTADSVEIPQTFQQVIDLLTGLIP